MLFFRFQLYLSSSRQQSKFKRFFLISLVMFTIYQVVITALNAPIVDRAGRKPLLLVNKMRALKRF